MQKLIGDFCLRCFRSIQYVIKFYNLSIQAIFVRDDNFEIENGELKMIVWAYPSDQAIQGCRRRISAHIHTQLYVDPLALPILYAWVSMVSTLRAGYAVSWFHGFMVSWFQRSEN